MHLLISRLVQDFARADALKRHTHFGEQGVGGMVGVKVEGTLPVGWNGGG